MTVEGRTLSHEEARRFYDRFGARQDSQGFYERPAVERMLAHLALDQARAVVEFGCGTGKLAAELLSRHLGPEGRYLGLDVSQTMVELARARTARFGERAEIRQTDGQPRIEAPAGSFDRFVISYVLDLLPADEIRAILDEAHRVLAPGGYLGVASLTPGQGGVARVVTWVWERIHELRPALVGGCRPIEVADRLPERGFSLRHRSVVSAYGIASEVVVAERP